VTRTRTIVLDGLHVEWDERVLEPRPWAVEQARWAAQILPQLPEGPLLELCTGSGYIGLLAAMGTDRRGVLVDADEAACALAARNAATAGLAHRVVVHRERATGAALDAEPGPFALVLADPPYLPSSEVRRYPDDPEHAVDGGPDGLAVLRDVLGTSAAVLHPSGACLLQLRGGAQADQVARALETDWSDIVLQPTELREFGPDRAVLRLDPC
jgi:methylase of polypeptide subunit release factors